MFRSALLIIFLGSVLAIDDGIGLSSPLGWSSWNWYGGNRDQTKMESVMDKVLLVMHVIPQETTCPTDGKSHPQIW